MSRAFRLTPIEPLEHDIQDAILRYLAVERRVAWFERFNVGAHLIDDTTTAKAKLLDRYAGQLYALHRNRSSALFGVLASLLSAYFAIKSRKKRFVRYAFPGCSDVLGQLVTGQSLAIECKRPGEGPSEEQTAFLARVTEAGGLAILARGIEDVQRALDAFFGEVSPNVQALRETAITPNRRSVRRGTG